MNKQDSVLTLCTRFDHLGDWTVEQQFVLQMGSSYLLAHGIGEPLKDHPHTEITLPAEGNWHLWVRTKNWTAFWSEGEPPGRFRVSIDGNTVGGGGYFWYWPSRQDAR